MCTSPPPPSDGEGLGPGDFVPVLTGGCGSTANDYPWSMVIVNGTAFIGTNRYHLCQMLGIIGRAIGLPIGLVIGAPCPPDPPRSNAWADDLAGRIYRYDLDQETAECEEVYRSPPLLHMGGVVGGGPFEAPPGRYPRAYGYRDMIVRPEDGSLWAVGIAPLAPYQIGGVHIVRSPDGGPGTWADATGSLAVEPVAAARSLVAWNGTVCVSVPRVLSALSPLAFAEPTLYCADDPTAEPELMTWTDRIDGSAMRATGNVDLYSLARWQTGGVDLLCAATANFRSGYEIHCTDGALADNATHYAFVPLHRGGMGEGAAQAGMSLLPVGDRLYVGTGSALGAIFREDGAIVGAVKGWELARFWLNGTGELLVGDTLARRVTGRIPELRESPSGVAAGYWNWLSPYAWTLAEHDGWLYLGSYDSVGPIARYAVRALCGGGNITSLLGGVIERLQSDRVLQASVCAWGRRAETLLRGLSATPGLARADARQASTLAHYVGTYLCETGLLRLLTGGGGIACTPTIERLLTALTERIAGGIGGADLYRSRVDDGVGWTPVTVSGFGHADYIGFRRLIGREDALYAAAASLYPHEPTAGFALFRGCKEPCSI